MRENFKDELQASLLISTERFRKDFFQPVKERSLQKTAQKLSVK